jgi:LysR family glycine cleavage system transcriptional activator
MLERGRIVALGSRSLLRTEERLLDPQNRCDMPVLLHRDMPNAFEAWKKAQGYPDLQPAQVSYFDAGQLILDAAAAGLGVAFMMESHLESSSDSRLARLFAGSALSPYAYWFACPPGHLERRGVRLFHDWLFDHFGDAEAAVPLRASA